MNYLAHAWLSKQDEELLIGNMIGDYVKGKQFNDYPSQVAKGIIMHRHIDTFTDEHEINKQAKTYLRSAAGLYAGAFLDIIYDHFLAINPAYFTTGSLWKFADDVYTIIDNYKLPLPPRFYNAYSYMKRDNWLYGYGFTEGVFNSFKGIAYRVKDRVNAQQIFNSFTQNYEALRASFNSFFPQLESFIQSEMNNP